MISSKQRLEKEQNDLDFLEALGDYKCDAGMSVEYVPAVVHCKTLKAIFIAQKFSTGWAVGVVKNVEKKKCVAGHKSETYSWTRKLNKKDYGAEKYWVLVAFGKD